jgi:hypothetical protein
MVQSQVGARGNLREVGLPLHPDGEIVLGRAV